MGNLNRLTEDQYKSMEKALEDRIKKSGQVEFHRLSNDLGEIWIAMRPDENDDFMVGFALCNPADKKLPRRYRRWKGRHIALSRLLSNRRPVSIKFTPIVENVRDRGRIIRETLMEQLFQEMEAALDAFPPNMFGVREYYGESERSSLQKWMWLFCERLYSDAQRQKCSEERG